MVPINKRSFEFEEVSKRARSEPFTTEFMPSDQTQRGKKRTFEPSTTEKVKFVRDSYFQPPARPSKSLFQRIRIESNQPTKRKVDGALVPKKKKARPNPISRRILRDITNSIQNLALSNR